MRRERLVERTERVAELVALGCNLCGDEVEPKGSPFVCDEQLQRIHEFVVSGSYSSEFPYDGTTLTFHLCATCLRTLVERFKVPPAEQSWLPGR